MSLFALVSAARAQPASFLSPSGRAPLLAGTTVPVEWVPPDPFDTETREMELVLSVDGGRTFGIRVSGEIEPGQTRVSWHVPALPTRQARLALRTGSGERDSETLRIVSGEFEIRQEGEAPEEVFLRIDGEWRTRDALLLPESGRSPCGAIEAEAALFASDAAQAAGTAPRNDPIPEPRPASREHLVVAAAAPPAKYSPPPLSRLAPIPLRE